MFLSGINSEAGKEQKQRHKDAGKLVHYVCQRLQSFETTVMMNYFFTPNRRPILHLATMHGAVELVEICSQYFPSLLWNRSHDGRFLLHVAVEHRQLRIFNHVSHLVGGSIEMYTETISGGENILHLAAKLPP